VSRQIILQVNLGIAQGGLIPFQQRVNLKSIVESEQSLNLILRQDAGSLGLHGKRFERMPRHVAPPPLKRFGDIHRQVNCEMH
jgi:hypothetical protein